MQIYHIDSKLNYYSWSLDQINLGATHKCQHWKKNSNKLFVGGFEGQLFKKSGDFENWKFIILKDKPSFWAILEALQIAQYFHFQSGLHWKEWFFKEES